MKKLEDYLEEHLKGIFGDNNVERNWDVAKKAQDCYNRRDLYAPRLDFAIGPFNISANIERNLAKINTAYNKYYSLDKYP